MINQAPIKSTLIAALKQQKMKKILYIPALLFSGLSLAQSSPNPKVAIDDNGLGRQFPDCLLSGSVCKLFTTDQDPKTSNANAYKTGENSFCIGIRKATISEEKQIAIMGKALKDVNSGESLTFRINTPYTVEQDFLKAININSPNAVIAAGSYPIEINAEYILIRLSF